MSYNGSGVFNINTAGQPVVTGTVISSTAFNALTADLATGLTTALTKDGQTTPTANIPMGGFKITGIAAATTLGDALSYGRAATVSTLTNSALTSGRVTYATTAGLLTDSANLLYSGTDLTVYGLTVGRGAGAVATNTAIGVSALAVNSSGANNTAVGYQAGYGQTTGSQAVYLGVKAGYTDRGVGNVFIGYQAGYTSDVGANVSNGSTVVGYSAGYSLTTGTQNTFIGPASSSSGYGSGYFVTTGSKNTIIGQFTGNSAGLDIRTASNYIVLSDGDGNPLISTANSQTVALKGAIPNSGAGITFPATQSASSNANTLDDYEEGTWTPTDGSGAGLSFTSVSAAYTKIGRQVFVNGTVTYPTTASTADAQISGLPFVYGSGTDYTQQGSPIRNNKSLSIQPFGLNSGVSSFVILIIGQYTTYATNVQLTSGTIMFSFNYYTT